MRQRVPRRYSEVEPRKVVWLSLYPDSEKIARSGAKAAWRHLFEGYFLKLKEVYRIAFRREKADASFLSMIHPAATVIGFDVAASAYLFTLKTAFAKFLAAHDGLALRSPAGWRAPGGLIRAIQVATCIEAVLMAMTGGAMSNPSNLIRAQRVIRVKLPDPSRLRVRHGRCLPCPFRTVHIPPHQTAGKYVNFDI